MFSWLITERTHAETMTRYSIRVHTSDIPQSVAEGAGFAIVHGPSISSKEILLARQSASTFHDGSEDTWTTRDMQDLGALQRLTIGLRDAVRFDQLAVSVHWLGCLPLATMSSMPCMHAQVVYMFDRLYASVCDRLQCARSLTFSEYTHLMCASMRVVDNCLS